MRRPTGYYLDPQWWSELQAGMRGWYHCSHSSHVRRRERRPQAVIRLSKWGELSLQWGYDAQPPSYLCEEHAQFFYGPPIPEDYNK